MPCNDSDGGWQIAGRFIIDGSQEDAERALEALERTAKRCTAAITIHVHASDPQERTE